jgi:hypothetical protein
MLVADCGFACKQQQCPLITRGNCVCCADVLCAARCCCVSASAVCPVGSGSGPDCDDCPDNMIQLEDGTCKSKCYLHYDSATHAFALMPLFWQDSCSTHTVVS